MPKVDTLVKATLLIVSPLIAPPPIEAEASDPTEVWHQGRSYGNSSRADLSGKSRASYAERMTEQELATLTSWIANVGLEGAGETVLIEGFCGRAVAAGLPRDRAIVFIDTLHPIHEGRVFRWERDKLAATVSEYGRSTEGEAAERWRRSPHYRLLETGEPLMRRRVTPETEREFPLFPALWEAAITEFVATVTRFSADGAIGEMDCFYAGWMTDQEGGFSDADVATLERLTPFLGLAIKSASLARIANTLVETYLGRDAGRRVLQGRIARGVADRIKTVLWFSDLRNYTRISDSAPPETIIPFLNDYADAIVSAIHEHSGDVLKLIGDGVLAIFSRRGSRPRVRRGTRRRSGCPRVGRSRQRTPPGARLADNRDVSRAPSWRGVLWQHRQQGAP